MFCALWYLQEVAGLGQLAGFFRIIDTVGECDDEMDGIWGRQMELTVTVALMKLQV